MVGSQLRALGNAAVGAGALTGAGVVTGRATHPVCGDEVEVDIRLVGGSLAELAWRAHGCPATHAVAAVAATVLPGTATAALERRLRDGLVQRGDLAAAERHAEAMFVRALRAALPPGPG